MEVYYFLWLSLPIYVVNSWLDLWLPLAVSDCLWMRLSATVCECLLLTVAICSSLAELVKAEDLSLMLDAQPAGWPG